MTDSEINLAIAKIEYPNLEWFGADHLAVTWNNGCRTECDYLQWADIGPIIERERIELVTFGWDAWLATRNEKARAETPTKAAALCYLKIKGVK